MSMQYVLGVLFNPWIVNGVIIDWLHKTGKFPSRNLTHTSRGGGASEKKAREGKPRVLVW